MSDYTYLKKLERLTLSFAGCGVTTITINSGGGKRARQMADKIGAKRLRIDRGPPLSAAKLQSLLFRDRVGSRCSEGSAQPSPIGPIPFEYSRKFKKDAPHQDGAN